VQIWVDADACPVVIKEILFRAATRLQVPLTLVANKPLRVAASPYIKTLQVSGGFDVADNEIAARMQPGDLVITADIPLASQVLQRGGHALNPRGELYSKDNIEERLSLRNFLSELRDSGVATGGPAPINQADRHAFARKLDSLLAKSRT
jgi:uncharacterized protein YaiI (UPF0178 family)